ncbi:hypothetical protein [Serratia sp. (in: enterobacteria)]|uniref:hypothetical protein n=1 Tax=Serratia sp. (in: enterobacteria) TaxID=616 RepID=UPI00398A1477
MDAKKVDKKETISTFVDDIKTQDQLTTELGPGVEKQPKLPEEPVLQTIKLDLSGALDVADLTKVIIDKLDIDQANKSMDRYDDYQGIAKKIWRIKESASDDFEISLRKGIKDKGKWKWERDKGRLQYEKKRFYYEPVTRQEKEEHIKLLKEKESANMDLIIETQKINKLIRNMNTDEQEKYLKKKEWLEISDKFGNAHYKYYSNLFQSYYGATDEDIERINFDDIINYVEIALYKEGIRSPQ